MLQLTEAAIVIIDANRTQRHIPSSYGIRVSATNTEYGEPAITIGFAHEPDVEDVVLEQHGRRVFVAPDVADRYGDAELDATVLASNNGDSAATLILRSQATD